MPTRRSRHDTHEPAAALTRLLESPALAAIVPQLPAETLHQLVKVRGLDACVEIVTAATPAQLTALLDLDVWPQPRPGREPRFDVERFGEWLDVLMDAGEAVAARTVAAMDPDLVVLGLSRYVRVFDPGIFEPIAQSDDEPIDRRDAMREGDTMWGDAVLPPHQRDAFEAEVAGQVVRARRTEHWDAIVALLVALDVSHGPFCHAVLHGCRRLSNSLPERDGFADVLLVPEQHLHDVMVAREQRRARQGYATPADARAFLAMARSHAAPSDASPAGPTVVNPIAAAYFREADAEPEATVAEPDRAPDASLAPEVLDLIREVLAEPDAHNAPPLRLGTGDDAPAPDVPACLQRLLARLYDVDTVLFERRQRELAFLANVLLDGCAVLSRPFTPAEAAAAAAATCNLGLESGRERGAHASGALPDTWLATHDLVGAFEGGWSILHREVGQFVAEQLIALVDRMACVDAEVQQDLTRLRRTLKTQVAAGTPWHARAALDVFAMLDPVVWSALVGLLGECPVLPDAVTAVLDGRTTAVDPAAFVFITTPDDLARVRTFMRRLPGLLSG